MSGSPPSSGGIEVQESRLHPRDLPLVVGLIPAGVLVDVFEIPRRDTRTKTGYQREPSATRVKRLALDLSRHRVSLPTALLLNLREFDRENDLPTENGRKFLQLVGKKLQVVDGQHRVLALEQLIDQDPDRWSGFTVPFVCLLGATEETEMEQFYVVNSTAKSVRTDLALDLLKQRAESDPKFMTALTEAGDHWKVRAQALAEDIADTLAWKGRIRFPGQPRAETTISSAGIVASLKGLLSTPFFGQLSQLDQVKILDLYWRAVRTILPGAFEEPSRFIVQKSLGAFTLHSLLVTVLELLRSQGSQLKDLDSYTTILDRPLRELEGDTQAGEPISGEQFWFSGPTGAAGAYSSSAGQRVLVARLRSLLPTLEVE